MDINMFSLCITLLSVGLLAYLCACQSQNEKSSWLSLWHWAALFVCIASIVFLSTTAGIYWKSNQASDFWNLATMVFTFFGILLTAGAAFATVAAAVSYFSVNQKLADAQKQLQLSQKQLQEMQESVLKFNNLSQESKNSLQEAEHSLNEFKQLDQERQKLQQELETLSAYKAVIQDLEQHNAAEIDEETQEKSLQAAKQILENPQAGFEARLKACAILRGYEISSMFKDLRKHETFDKWMWQQLISMQQDNLEIWKLLFYASQFDDPHHRSKNNYCSYLFQAGYIYHSYGDKLLREFIPDNNQDIDIWVKCDDVDEKKELLKEVLLQYDLAGIQLKKARSLIGNEYTVITHLALTFMQKAVVVTIIYGKSKEKSEADKLWDSAVKLFEQMKEERKYLSKILLHWGGMVTNRADLEVKIGNVSEAKKLWRESREKFRESLLENKKEYLASKNWINSIKNEIKSLELNEPSSLILWQENRKRVYELYQTQLQSEVIQNLLEDIDAEIQKLASQEHKP